VKLSGLLVALALLPGCSTHPITGRDQIIALPAVQAAHADLGYAFAAGVQRIVAPPACEQDCGGKIQTLASFTSRAEAIGARLEASARDLAPDLFGRIERFQIEVDDGIGVATGSSAGGRVVLGAGLVGLEPADSVIAFLIAREMAHVIARHAEENSGSSIVFSALGMLLPGINFIARFIASSLGSSALTGSWAAQQQREADEIAITLLDRTGLSVRSVALGLEGGINRARLPEDEWGARYLGSAQRVAAIAASPARYAVIVE